MRSSRRACMVAAVFMVIVPGRSAVLGYSQAAQPLTAERVRALPEQQRSAWTAYLQQSEAARIQDHAALAAERRGMKSVPAEPRPGSSARSVPVDRPTAWYSTPEARHIADVVVSFQTPAGGWGKNLDMSGAVRQAGQSYVSDNLNRFASPGDLDAPRDPAWHYVGTLDNDATTTELEFLAKVQASLPEAQGTAYRESFLRGLRYVLEAQYPNGGWPQVWPLEGGYHDAITFNDDAMLHAMELLDEVSEAQPEVSFVPEGLRQKARSASGRAKECVLTTQVVLRGRKTIWPQQVDMLTLRPVAARNFEPVALSTGESAHILGYLMSLRKPPEGTDEAISAGVTWLEQHAVYNEVFTGGRDTPEGRRLVAKQGAGPIWARYYSLSEEKPIFGDRDKSIHDDVNEISLERRNGYAWFNSEAAAVIARFRALPAHAGSDE